MLAAAIDAVSTDADPRPRLLMSARGKKLDQTLVADLAFRPGVLIVAGRFEGVDERVTTSLADEVISIGDYVLTGGELPALVVIDAVLRLLPGAIDAASTDEESFSSGLLEYPQYTRPAAFRGLGVPPVLVSGHHAEVAKWRHERSLERTRARRPDLLPSEDASGESQP